MTVNVVHLKQLAMPSQDTIKTTREINFLTTLNPAYKH